MDVKLDVDSEKIKAAVEMGLPVSVTTYTLPHEMEIYIDSILKAILKSVCQEALYDYISYSLRELTTNAKKANTKRVYFNEKNLDIKNPNDYQLGMESFKSETLEDHKYWFNLQKEAGLYIKITFKVTPKVLVIQVANNVGMSNIEQQRIQQKIDKAQQYDTVEEVFDNILDDSEGAGLGIVIMLLMLKQLGMSAKTFSINSHNDITIAGLAIPLNFSIRDDIETLTSEIVKFIDKMPQFPERILEIQRLINDPDSNISSIANLIAADVGITSDLLKMVNSAGFGLSKVCTNISEAVKFVGMQGLRNLLYSVGTLEVLDKQSEQQKKYWEHSYKTAFFSYNLAKQLKQKALLDDIYVCGLLHNLGTIVLSSLYPETIQKIEQFTNEKQLSPKVNDIVMTGFRQHDVGAHLAKKWQLPAQVINTIRYHKNLEDCPKEFESLVFIVYAANLLILLIDKKLDYEQISEKTLQRLNINSQAQLEELCNYFEKAFNEQSNRH